MLQQDIDENIGPLSSVNTEEFFDEKIFNQELEKIFLKRPLPLAALSQLKNDGDFVSKTLLGRPLLIVRESQNYRVFLNVCRHRGAKLIAAEQSGQCRGIQCPYHGWTYDLTGQLKRIPEETRGFAGLDKKTLGLREIKSFSKAGFLWVCFDDHFELSSDSTRFFQGISEELDEHHFENYTFLDCKVFERNFNWKVGAHAFLEGYHFATAHQKSAARYYIPNRFLLDIFEENFRFVLPRYPLDELLQTPDLSLGELVKHITILYAIFPNTFLFWLHDHLTTIHFFPITAQKTRVECYVLLRHAPKSKEEAEYFELNKNMFYKISEEDLQIGEGIQEGFASRANERFILGTFENCIERFQNLMAKIKEKKTE